MRLFQHFIIFTFSLIRNGSQITWNQSQQYVLRTRVFARSAFCEHFTGSMVWNVSQIKYMYIVHMRCVCANDWINACCGKKGEVMTISHENWIKKKNNSIEKFMRIKTTCFTWWMRVIPLHLLRVFFCKISDLMTAVQQQQQQRHWIPRKRFLFLRQL